MKDVVNEFLHLNALRLAKGTYVGYSILLRCPPEIGNLPIADIQDSQPIVEILRPRSPKQRPVAKNLFAEVFDFAEAKRYRTGLNPARFKIKHWLQQPEAYMLEKIHHPSMPCRDVPRFLAEERGQTPRSLESLCIEFPNYTAARPGEAAGLVWDEIDLKTHLWSVPACRMKKRKPHFVPLSTQAVAILQLIKERRFSSRISES